MTRRRVPQREVPALVAELRERGATEVQRQPVRMDGTVLVTWREEGGTEVDTPGASEVNPWALPIVLGCGFAALVVAVVVGIVMANSP